MHWLCHKGTGGGGTGGQAGGFWSAWGTVFTGQKVNGQERLGGSAVDTKKAERALRVSGERGAC